MDRVRIQSIIQKSTRTSTKKDILMLNSGHVLLTL